MLMNMSALSCILSKHFFGSFARVNRLSEIIFALVQTRDVNLTGIATCLQGNASNKSRYRFLQRFVADLNFCYMRLAKFLLEVMEVDKSEKWLIAIDRTNWKFGSFNINIFMLSICWKNIAIPLIWTMLDKDGTSNTEERKDLISLFIKWFGSHRIAGLIGDREFIGDTWMKWLDDMKIPFYLRIKDGMQIANSRGAFRTSNHLTRSILPGHARTLKGARKLGQKRAGPEVYISALRRIDGELVIIATNDKPELAADTYKRRWEIETLFGCMKTRGFNLENTHLIHLERIRTLVALVAIAFVIGYKIGLWLNDKKPIKLKKHGYKEQSFFRYGLDYIRAILFNCSNDTRNARLIEILEVLSKPPKLPKPYFTGNNRERLMGY